MTEFMKRKFLSHCKAVMVRMVVKSKAKPLFSSVLGVKAYWWGRLQVWGPETFHRRESLEEKPYWINVQKLICQKHFLLLKEMGLSCGIKIECVIIVYCTCIYLNKLKETRKGLKLKQDILELSSKISFNVRSMGIGNEFLGKLWNFFLWLL